MQSPAALFFAAIALIGLATPTMCAQPETKTDPTAAGLTAALEGEPLVSPRATQYDFTSRINGQKYRVMVSVPYKTDPAKTYPVFYLFDGNWYFRAAADTVTEASGARSILPAIVVGIGYPTDNNGDVGRRRGFDLTLPAGPAGQAARPNQPGGGDDFVRVLLEEVRPFVQARYKVDETRQTLYGKSLGGLMVLRVLFRNPGAFQTYIAASPSIWWNDRAVLADEEAFSRQAKAGTLHLKLLLTSAGDEQYRGINPVQLLGAQRSRMIDNASDLAARLAALNPEKVVVARTIFPDEDHVSVSLASLGRALTFALKP